MTMTDGQSDKQRAANRRTGLVLLSIVLVFFFGAIVSRLYGTPTVSIGVLGCAVLLFLVLAIGRNLRK
jgi:uncharacterized membrane protein YoaK (UPF0700 family)